MPEEMFPQAEPDVLPSEEELTSPDWRVLNRAWDRAYPILWKWGMQSARKKLAGPHLEDQRENVVALAISQFQANLLKKLSSNSPLS